MGNVFNDGSKYKDISEQERIDQINVSMGNAPVVRASVQQAGEAALQADYAHTAPVTVKETSQDNKCPSCGATLTFDPKSGGLVCGFCGNHVAINTIPAAPGLGYTLEELQNNGGRRLQYGMKQIVCGTCGGQFLADPSSISGLCPYCGSNSITVSTESSGMPEPTGIIPFKISKEEAQDLFKQWITKRRFAPMDIASNTQVTDLTGVYVPYWVFDCDTYTPYSGKFGKIYGSGDDQYTKYHKSKGVCKMPVKNLTIIASSRLENDPYWRSISSFNLNFMKKYDPDLLAGFWAESYTVDGTSAWKTAMGKIHNMIENRIRRMESADTIAKLDMNPEASNIRAKYVLAPVWITSFSYNGQLYRVLINGQTSNVVGTWPKSFKKFFLIIGIIAGAIFGTRILFSLWSFLVQLITGR